MSQLLMATRAKAPSLSEMLSRRKQASEAKATMNRELAGTVQRIPEALISADLSCAP
jgi:hypothetical protein